MSHKFCILYLNAGSQKAEVTLLALCTMTGTNGKPLKIIKRIAVGNYKVFGMCLLNDDNMIEVDLLESANKHNDAVGITQAIIQKWLGDAGPSSCTYQHFIECLKQSELGALAEDIANVIQGITHTSMPQKFSACFMINFDHADQIVNF